MANNKSVIKENLTQALYRAEHWVTRTKLAVKEKFNLLEPIKILPFYGFGNDRYVFIKGRVMEEEKILDEPEDQTVKEHLKDTYKRYETDEIPNIKVKASFGGRTIETETDAEGFFEVEFKFEEPIDYKETGKVVHLELLETKTDEDQTTAEGQIFVPGADSEFGVISDIDDTVMVSRMNHFFEKLRIMLLQDASDRTPFPGIGAFLDALCLGSNGKGNNPLFYVSGSEWNLYDLLVNFMKYHDIPQGPLFLKDKGLDSGKKETENLHYKRKIIRHILDTYPDLKFICIGDSGQHDPEVYENILKEYPDRLLGIYIRDVTPDKRDGEVKEIKKMINSKGTEMELLPDTFTAARHSLGMGWINKDQLDTIRKSCEKDTEK